MFFLFYLSFFPKCFPYIFPCVFLTYGVNRRQILNAKPAKCSLEVQVIRISPFAKESLTREVSKLCYEINAVGLHPSFTQNAAIWLMLSSDQTMVEVPIRPLPYKKPQSCQCYPQRMVEVPTRPVP